MEGENEAAQAVVEVIDSARKANYSEAFASRSFVTVFSTGVLSVAADTIRIVALSALIYSASGSVLLSALSFGIGFLPQVIGSSFLGAIADRYRTKPRLLLNEAIDIVTTGVIGYFHLPIWLMLVLLGTNAALTPPLRNNSRLLTAVLKGDAFVLGRSLLNMSSQAAQLIGLGVSGFIIAGIGQRHALLVSAGAHVVAFVLLLAFLREPQGTTTISKGSLVKESWRGQRAVLTNTLARRVLVVQWGPSMCAAMAESIIVAYCISEGLGEHSPGLLMACYPMGLIVGDVVVGKGCAPRTRERLVPALIVLLGLPLVIFFASPPLVVSMICILLSGSGFSYALGVQRVFLDAVPEALRGQSFAVLGAGNMTVQGLGALAGGGLSEWIGIGPTMAVAGLLTILIAGWWFAIQRGDERIVIGPRVEGGVA